MIDEIITTQDGPIATVKFNRANRRNAITSAMYDALTHAFKLLDVDTSTHVILLTGDAQYFTAGNDLADFVGYEKRAGERLPALTFLHAIHALRKPLVAAVEGGAVGIGATMLQHCDFVYAGKSTKFSLPFAHFGLPQEGGVSALLAQGPLARQVKRWVMLGDPFTADEAKAAGLVTEVVADGTALEQARRTAVQLTERRLDALIASKDMMRRATPLMPHILDEEVEHFTRLLASPYTQTSLTALTKKTEKKA